MMSIKLFFDKDAATRYAERLAEEIKAGSINGDAIGGATVAGLQQPSDPESPWASPLGTGRSFKEEQSA